MGTKVNAISKELKSAITIDNAKSLKIVAANPPVNTIGIKTATVVNVEAVIAIDTSFVPSTDAAILSTPKLLFLYIFSRTTIELSTNIPIPSAKPPIVIIFNVISAKYKITNVVIIDIGIESAITNVVLKLLRNIKSITIANKPPTNAVFVKFLMAKLI